MPVSIGFATLAHIINVIITSCSYRAVCHSLRRVVVHKKDNHIVSISLLAIIYIIEYTVQDGVRGVSIV